MLSCGIYISGLDIRQCIIYINFWNGQDIILSFKYYNTLQNIMSNAKNIVNQLAILRLLLKTT